MLAYSTTKLREHGPIPTNPARDAAHFACGRRIAWLEGVDPAAPRKASHTQNGPRQHRALILNRS